MKRKALKTLFFKAFFVFFSKILHPPIVKIGKVLYSFSSVFAENLTNFCTTFYGVTLPSIKNNSAA